MTSYAETPQRRFQCVSPIFSILYYGFGLLVVHKYHELGLRVVCYSFAIFLEPFWCVVCVGVFRPYHRFFSDLATYSAILAHSQYETVLYSSKF